MKLYATTTSERASKGQGGNDYLEIEVTDEEKNTILKLSIRPTMYGYTMQGKSFHRKTDEVFAYDRYIGDEWVSKGSKGERQKGDYHKCRKHEERTRECKFYDFKSDPCSEV